MIIWIVCQLLCWNDDRWIIKTDTEDLSRVLIPIFAIFTSFFSLSHPALLLVQIITLTQSAQLGRSVGVHVFSWLPVRIEEFLTAGAMVAHSFPNSSILGHPWHHTRNTPFCTVTANWIHVWPKIYWPLVTDKINIKVTSTSVKTFFTGPPCYITKSFPQS
jgi:hypothetical protein